MAVRTLQQIVNELNKADAGQISSLQKRQSLIPQQIASEEKGLGAKQEQAFGDILGGARRRGLGFAGIPLEEQARYTSTEYLPALARLRQTGQEQQMSLADQIMAIRSGNAKMAQGLRSDELNRAEQIRQFNENLRFQREQAAAAQRASSGGGGGGGGFSPSFGSLPSASQGANKASTVPSSLQTLYNQMFIRSDGNRWDDNALKSDFARTRLSASRGNARDRQKLQLYYSARPDLFSGYSGSALNNNPRF